MKDRRERRLRREIRTIEAMIQIFCEGRHGSSSLCPTCRELRDYALCRIDKCPWGADKPACANCEIHCYRPPERERIREVMRFAGPRMLRRHPILALLHLVDGRRPGEKTVLLEKRRQSAAGGR